MKHVVGFSHQLLQEAILKGDTVVDATCGNGNDTLFLSSLVEDNGRVLAFDIQKQAINTTQQKITERNMANVRLIQDSHEQVASYLKETEQIGGAIFNLGYLPGSDKTVITKGLSTMTAVESMLAFLRKQGVIVLVIYHGHIGGAEEKETILDYVTSLDQKHFQVLQYRFINQSNDPPFIIAIEKK